MPLVFFFHRISPFTEHSLKKSLDYLADITVLLRAGALAKWPKKFFASTYIRLTIVPSFVSLLELSVSIGNKSTA